MEYCENGVCLEHIMMKKSDMIGLEKIGWHLTSIHLNQMEVNWQTFKNKNEKHFKAQGVSV